MYNTQVEYEVIEDSTISPNIRTDDSANVVHQHTLQVPMIQPMRAQAGQTSMIAETDDLAQWAESVLGRIIQFPKQTVPVGQVDPDCSH